MATLVRTAYRSVGLDELEGTGVELGAGCGLLAATVATGAKVDRVYAVEICQVMADKIVPRVAERVLGINSHKVVPVFGSFDRLELDSNSVDFVVEIDSLHHSDDLAKTVAEAARVLKPGGRMLCLDRVHPNSVTDAEVESMLSQVYSRDFLIKSCYPPDVILTRRENGEHEFRRAEWEAAFAVAGLILKRTRTLHYHPRTALALKGVVSVAPRFITRNLYGTDNATLATSFQWLTQWIRNWFTRVEDGRPVLAPKNTTVMLLEKPR
jgi:SAM-dependent methyltransferase